MFGPKPGTWWVRSDKDPRWDKTGRSDVGCFTMNKEAEQWIELCELKYGPKPDDLEWGYMKD